MKRVAIVVVLFLSAVFVTRGAQKDPGKDGDGDVVIKPPYAAAPECMEKEGVPKGTVHEFIMNSEDSKLYPGIKGAYKRQVWVYVPSQYKPGTAAPFIVAHDGKQYAVVDGKEKAPLATILDNMIHEKRLPPMIAVMLHHGGQDGKGSERGLEYDTLSPKYAEFIETEVLPKIEKDYNVKFTKDPEGRATVGGSSGGAVAFTMAWFRPDLYRKVITYSGTYVNQQSPTDEKLPHGAWEYHEHLIPENDVKPIRLWMEVGENDNGAKSDEKGMHNWVMANNRMAEVLKAKGYHYRYVFAEGAKHVDRGVVSQTLPEALEYVWRGYTPE